MMAGCDSLTDVQQEKQTIKLANGSTLIEANDGNLSLDKQQDYQEIAEKLAIRFVYKRNPRQTAIPNEVVLFLYSGLVHVHNSKLHEAEVFTKEYRIMARAPARPRGILLSTKKSKPWLDNWRSGKTKTGIPEINVLLEEFDFSLERYREFSTSDDGTALMRSPRP